MEIEGKRQAGDMHMIAIRRASDAETEGEAKRRRRMTQAVRASKRRRKKKKRRDLKESRTVMITRVGKKRGPQHIGKPHTGRTRKAQSVGETTWAGEATAKKKKRHAG